MKLNRESHKRSSAWALWR